MKIRKPEQPFKPIKPKYPETTIPKRKVLNSWTIYCEQNNEEVILGNIEKYDKIPYLVYSIGYDQVYLNLCIDEDVPNPDLQSQLEVYEKQLENYNAKCEEYDIKIIEYNSQLEVYKKQEIEALENRINKLKIKM